MTKLYKLTDAHGRTYNKTQWGENVTHSGTGEGELCGPGFIHAYESALLAVLLNPIHANFQNPKLWEAEGEIVKNDRGLKCGCISLTTLRELPLPEITKETRVKFAILCVTQIYKDPIFLKWTAAWLSGEDRSSGAARAAEAAAGAAAWAAWDAAWAAARAASRAAEAAWTAEAARAASRAAEAARAAAQVAVDRAAARAAEAAARAATWAAPAAEAARAAEAAAEAAAWAARAAEGIEYKLNLIQLAEEACNNVI